MAGGKKKSLLLRISPELHELLTRWAHDELRSVNAQIEYILRQAVARRFGRLPDDQARSSGPDDRDSQDAPGGS